MFGKSNTKIYLTNVSWDSSYKDVRQFTDSPTQFEYFTKLEDTYDGLSEDDYRFIDGDGNSKQHDIKISMKPEEAQGYNYLFYRNYDSDNNTDWVYCFISSVDYVNHETSLVHLTEDIMQTYMFKYDMMSCSVKREHVVLEQDRYCRAPDILPSEPNYISDRKNLFNSTEFLPYICCTSCLTKVKEQQEYIVNEKGSTLNGKHIPFVFIVCDSMEELIQIKNWHESGSQYEFDIKNFISYGWVSKQIIPRPCIINSYHPVGYQINVYGASTSLVSQSEVLYEAIRTYSMDRPLNIIGKTPGLNFRKLSCSPYLNIEINNMGNTMEFAPENFGSETFTFGFSYTFTDTFHCNVYPFDYNGSGTGVPNFSKMLELTVGCTFPIDLSTYLQYMNANKQQILTERIGNGVSIATGAGMIVGGIAMSATGAGAGAGGAMVGSGITTLIGGTASTIKSESALAHKEAMDRKELTDGYGSDYLAIIESFSPQIYIKQINPAFVGYVEQYFLRFGYAVDKYGIPNRIGRDFNYVETANCKIKPKGNGKSFMNNDTKLQIQAVYDSGVRLWNVDMY